MSFLSTLLSPKKGNLRNPKPYTLKNNYTCEDSRLEWNIKAYLNREISTKDCLQNLIEYIAYRDCLHMFENQELFCILEDFLDVATWKTNQTLDCGDYNPTNPEPWLCCIYGIYSCMLTDINNAETSLKNLGKEINMEEVMNYIHNESVTPEIYKNRVALETKEAELRSIICGGNFTPKEILLLIKDNWELLYPHRSIYEAIEYCIVASENHTIHKYFDSAFRDYGYKLGPLYRQANEH